MSKPNTPTTHKDHKHFGDKDKHHSHPNSPTTNMGSLSKTPQSSVMVLIQSASCFPADKKDADASSSSSPAAESYAAWRNQVMAAAAPVATEVHPVELSQLGALDKAPPSEALQAVISHLQRLKPAAVVGTHVSMLPLLVAVGNASRGQVFTVMADAEVSKSPVMRISAYEKFGVHMVSHVMAHVTDALRSVCAVATDRPQHGGYSCPFCAMSALNQIELWHHTQLFHIGQKNSSVPPGTCCPICRSECGPGLFVHIHDAHAPPGTHLDARSDVKVHSFGLCVIRHPATKKFLCVVEYGNQGLWLPGGGVDPAEQPWDAAARECVEEAGVKVKLTGVLRVESSPHVRRGSGYLRLRYIFYGEPVDPNDCEPKTAPDFESMGAVWCTLDEVKKARLRGQEPLDYFGYVEAGGIIAPMHILGVEGAEPGCFPL